MIKEVDVDKDGSISVRRSLAPLPGDVADHPDVQFDEYLDVAAGAKQVHLHNAFTDIALKGSLDDASEEQGRQGGHRGSGDEPPQKDGVKIDYSNKMPPEKTGGGW